MKNCIQQYSHLNGRCFWSGSRAITKDAYWTGYHVEGLKLLLVKLLANFLKRYKRFYVLYFIDTIRRSVHGFIDVLLLRNILKFKQLYKRYIIILTDPYINFLLFLLRPRGHATTSES